MASSTKAGTTDAEQGKPAPRNSNGKEIFDAIERLGSAPGSGPSGGSGTASSSSASGGAKANDGGSPNKGPCGCLRRAKADPPFQQTLVILRHSERQDRVDPGYHDSEEGKAWPHDAPLTRGHGIDLAQRVAKELAEINKEANFHVIACSPYKRCMETAAEVAKVIGVPVLVDQEIGEVRDRTQPETPSPHRSALELKTMAQDLQVKTLNPILEDGSLKMFGKPPTWPETLDDAKNRYIVRIETYIRQSMETKQNMIIVTHADAVAAALVMFERGGADVQKMDFCARIIARRSLKQEKKGQEDHGVFAAQWKLEFKDLGAELLHDAAMAKYYEKQHLEQCDETQQMVAKRKDKRTKTDMMFDNTMKDLLTKQKKEEDEEEAREAAKEAKEAAANKV